MKVRDQIRFAVCFLALSLGPISAAVAQTADQLRKEIQQLRESFTTQITELERRLSALETSDRAETRLAPSLDGTEEQLPISEYSASQPVASLANQTAFNPRISVILSGTYARLSNDPDEYTLQGFIPAGEETGPAPRSFSLGESELTLSANIDPLFYGQATFAVTPENEIEVEEAFVRSIALPSGINAQFGRFFSAVGYINEQHAHVWDFVDAPLVYDAMLGGQYRDDGVRLSWLAPLETYLEFGLELGNGAEFPGAEQSKNGVRSTTLYAKLGGDVGYSGSWQASLAYLDVDVKAREYLESDSGDPEILNPTVFGGDSGLWSLGGVYKWAPGGNSRDRNFKLQAEYLHRDEEGRLEQDNARLGAGEFDYDAQQAGWYLQGVYQFRRAWRLGLRYDRLDAGEVDLRSLDGVLQADDLPILDKYDPKRLTFMLDYSPTEFSRLRLQFSHDESAPGNTDKQIYLQYLMSLGVHGAHTF